jgi:hypothetical protein
VRVNVCCGSRLVVAVQLSGRGFLVRYMRSQVCLLDVKCAFHRAGHPPGDMSAALKGMLRVGRCLCCGAGGVGLMLCVNIVRSISL